MKYYQVTFSDTADETLRAIFYNILFEYNDVIGARRTVDRIVSKCMRLSLFPKSNIIKGKIDGREIRFTHSGKYTIVYYADDRASEVVIVRVLYSRMNLDDIIDDFD